MFKTTLLGGLLFCLCGTALAETPGGVSALVQTMPLRQMTLSDRISGYGTVMPEPGATVNLNLAKAGQVTQILVAAGELVKKGQPLLELSTDPAATLAFGQAENAVAFAKQELKRTESLLARQLATRSQVDAATRALKDAEQAWASQNAQGAGDRITVLKAPFSGLVVSTAIAQGDRVQPGTNLIQLSHTQYLRARLGIEPGDSQRLRQGMAVRLASVFDPKRTVDGKVTQVGGQVDPQTQLVDVTVRFSGAAFLPGTRLRGDVAAMPHVAWSVPRQAVLQDSDGAYLFQVVAGKAVRIRVETGTEDGDWVEVRATGLLKAPVVVLGNYEMEDGMAVREGKP
jgi:RND family efflux transporter MFP subunit